jgi:DNA adenine methylase
MSIQSSLTDVHQRISRATIEHLDVIDCICRYDRKTTLFFIDPPYLDVAGYAVPFPKERYQELADILKSISGKFILTINDHPFIRNVFADYPLQEINTSYCIKKGSPQLKIELLLKNF